MCSVRIRKHVYRSTLQRTEHDQGRPIPLSYCCRREWVGRCSFITQGGCHHFDAHRLPFPNRIIFWLPHSLYLQALLMPEYWAELLAASPQGCCWETPHSGHSRCETLAPVDSLCCARCHSQSTPGGLEQGKELRLAAGKNEVVPREQDCSQGWRNRTIPRARGRYM